VEEAKSLYAEIERDRRGLKAMDLVDEAVRVHMGGGPGQGQREQHPWTKAIIEGDRGGAFGQKGVTGGGQGSVVVGSLGDPAARLGAPGGELLALLTVEGWDARGDGAVVSFLRETTRDLKAAVVATGAAKPESSIGLDMLSADVLTYAHVVSHVPLQWFADAANLDAARLLATPCPKAGVRVGRVSADGQNPQTPARGWITRRRAR
jgi:hypothetical protein